MTKYILVSQMLALLLPICAAAEDFVLEGMFEAAVDLPRIMFLIKRDPNGEPIKVYDDFEDDYVFVEQYAFLDTGASGVLFSRETALLYMELNLEEEAVYYDVGVGGAEDFNVSEPIYIGTLDYNSPQSLNPGAYKLHEQWRIQVKKTYVEDWFSSPIDIIGTPAMMGKVVVLNSASTNQLGSFIADIKEANDVTIPEVDFEVAIRFEKFVWDSEDSNNIPPYPILAYNPMIDVILDYNNISVDGRFLLDTGAMVSMMNIDRGMELGLVDANGDPIIEPNFVVQLGGVGSNVEVPGFIIDTLKVPTLNGFDLVYKNARVTVHDIGVYDFDNNEYLILDGIFGSNFLCATLDSNIMDLNLELAGTVYDWVVIDMNQGKLGFDVNDIHSVPINPDIAVSDKIDSFDLQILIINWLREDCNEGNYYCTRSDINKDGSVNGIDYSMLAGWWGEDGLAVVCGGQFNPWPTGDFTRDCKVDILDLAVLARQWLAGCSWYDWNCIGADIDRDGAVNFKDMSEIGKSW